MRLIRSWPADPPAGHPRVDDRLERVETPPFDYSPLAALGDDVVHLDWDIACSPEDLAVFAEAARRQPGQVLVGPYRTYPGSVVGADPVPRDLAEPVWTAKVYTTGTETAMRWVQPTDYSCHLFGFGLVYLPAGLLTGFVAANPGAVMSDMAFSGWHNRNIAYATRLCWQVRPVHTNHPPPVL